MEHVLLVLFFTVGLYMYVEANEFAPAAQQFPKLMAGTTVILSFLLLVRNYLTHIGPLLAIGLGVYFGYTGATTVIDEGTGYVQLIGGILLVVGSIVYRERVGNSIEAFVAEPMQLGGDMDQMGGVEDDSEVDDPEASEPAESTVEEGTEETEAMYVYDIDDWRGPVVTGVLSIIYMMLTYTIGMLYATPIFVAAWTVWARMDVIRATGITLLSFVTAYLFYDIISDDIAQGWLTGWEPAPPDDLYDMLVDFLGLSVYVPEQFGWLASELFGRVASNPSLLEWGVILA